jgi:hypothetical protein
LLILLLGVLCWFLWLDDLVRGVRVLGGYLFLRVRASSLYNYYLKVNYLVYLLRWMGWVLSMAKASVEWRRSWVELRWGLIRLEGFQVIRLDFLRVLYRFYEGMVPDLVSPSLLPRSRKRWSSTWIKVLMKFLSSVIRISWF